MSAAVGVSELPQAPAWVRLSRRGIRLLPRGRYVLMNWLCRRRAARPFESPLGVTRDRVRFACDLRDAIAREACFMGHYEPLETALVRSLLKPGMTFIDVGANWGYFTLLAASMVGATGRVVSLEPHPTLYRLLEQNVERNRFEWVTTLRVAAAGEEGEMNLAGYAGGDSNRGVSRLTRGVESQGPNYHVKTGRLETLLDDAGVGEVDLLKMDIEGGEGDVIPTLRDGLARARYKHILLELHPRALAAQGIDAAGLVEEIKGQGYRAWRLDHSAETFRRASYKLPDSTEKFLEPLDPREPLGEWPHILFVAPPILRPTSYKR